MRHIILSDIHANLEAFREVLNFIKKEDKVLCLGDTIGYGPNPNECLDIVIKKEIPCLVGNHEAGVLGKLDKTYFNAFAYQAIQWTRKTLSKKNKEFLKRLPERKVLMPIMTLVHASPRDPVLEYVYDLAVALQNFDYFETPLSFIGHTHVPTIFEKKKDNIRFLPLKTNEKIKLKKEAQYLINVGSIGQPRDSDPRSSFAIFDDKDFTLKLKRVKYNFRTTQKKILKEGLPSFLGQRLKFGY